MTSPSDVTVESVTEVLEEERPAPEGFVIDTEEKAAWAVDKLISLEAAEERLTVQYEKNVHRAARATARAREFFVPMLESFYRANLPKKGKTLHLATGDLCVRAVPPRFEVRDEDAVLAWAQRVAVEKLDVRVAERIAAAREDMARAEAKKIAKETHKATEVLPDGCALTEAGESFTIKSPKEG